jgi:hypothetical protein
MTGHSAQAAFADGRRRLAIERAAVDPIPSMKRYRMQLAAHPESSHRSTLAKASNASDPTAAPASMQAAVTRH